MRIHVRMYAVITFSFSSFLCSVSFPQHEGCNHQDRQPCRSPEVWSPARRLSREILSTVEFSLQQNHRPAHDGIIGLSFEFLVQFGNSYLQELLGIWGLAGKVSLKIYALSWVSQWVRNAGVCYPSFEVALDVLSQNKSSLCTERQ